MYGHRWHLVAIPEEDENVEIEGFVAYLVDFTFKQSVITLGASI